MSNTSLTSLAIVGAGFSALSLLRQIREQRLPVGQVHLFGDANEFATGMAYTDSAGASLLNTRAADVGLSPTHLGEFADWAGLSGGERDTFQTREAFGGYLRDALSELTKCGDFPIKLIKQRVTGIVRHEHGFRVSSAHSSEVVDRVVLATGPLPPTPLSMLADDVRASVQYVDDPWRVNWTDGLDADARVVVIGTGLTMVDHVARLRARGQRGPVLAISRHGWLPRPHPVSRLPSEPLSDALLQARDGGSVQELLRAMRCACAGREDWPAAFDAMRAHTGDIWRGLSDRERKRFLRHVRSAWDAHRHRMAPHLWAELKSWIGEGWLRIVSGRIVGSSLIDGAIALRVRQRSGNTCETVPADLLLRAAGIDGPLRPGHDPLIDDLIAQRMVYANPLGLGIDVDDIGRVLDADGQCVPGLFASGALTRGRSWECTAIPELRKYAGQLAGEITRVGP